MEQPGFANEKFAQIFMSGSFYEILGLLILLPIGIFLFLKRRRKYTSIIGVIIFILLFDIVHTGISVWKASKILVDRHNSNVSYYPSIYHDKIIREENHRIDTVYSYYLNLYGIGPREGISLLYNLGFFNKFTTTFLIDFRVVRTPVLLTQYYYIKNKRYPYYIKYSDTDLVMAMFEDRRLEFKVFSNRLFSSEEYLQATEHLQRWVNNVDISEISVVIENYSVAPVVNAQAGALLNNENVLRDLTLSTLVRLGEK